MGNGIRVVSVFYGEKHLDLWEKVLVRSLSWPLNKEALQGAAYDVWTTESLFAIAADIAKVLGIKIELHAMDSFLADLPTKYLNDSGVMMNQIFLLSMRRCIDSGARMLLAPPDTCFGGDSVANILDAATQPGTVVFLPHIRVLPSIIPEIDTPA